MTTIQSGKNKCRWTFGSIYAVTIITKVRINMSKLGSYTGIAFETSQVIEIIKWQFRDDVVFSCKPIFLGPEMLLFGEEIAVLWNEKELQDFFANNFPNMKKIGTTDKRRNPNLTEEEFEEYEIWATNEGLEYITNQKVYETLGFNIVIDQSVSRTGHD